MENLLQEIECKICENHMRTHSGCDGMCKYDENLMSRIKELFRLAEIGKALERATKIGTAWVFVESIGECIYPSEEEIQSLVLWYRECNKEFYAI